MKQKTKYLMVTLAISTLIGCGGGSSATEVIDANDTINNDIYKIQPVEYSLNGSNIPLCPNAAYIESSSGTENNTGSLTCTWFCGEYEGARPINVGLTFIQNEENGVWEFYQDSLSTAPNSCHD